MVDQTHLLRRRIYMYSGFHSLVTKEKFVFLPTQETCTKGVDEVTRIHSAWQLKCVEWAVAPRIKTARV